MAWYKGWPAKSQMLNLMYFRSLSVSEASLSFRVIRSTGISLGGVCSLLDLVKGTMLVWSLASSEPESPLVFRSTLDAQESRCERWTVPFLT